jgi:hypothetical protein
MGLKNNTMWGLGLAETNKLLNETKFSVERQKIDVPLVSRSNFLRSEFVLQNSHLYIFIYIIIADWRMK